MRSLSKACMEILEDCARPCSVALSPNSNWTNDDDAHFDGDVEEELLARGLVVSLPCDACLRVFNDDHCYHCHLTARGIEALHFYRSNPELLE